MTTYELAGLPGAGKSTLIRRAENALRDGGVEVHLSPEQRDAPPRGWKPDLLALAEPALSRCENADTLRRVFRQAVWHTDNAVSGVLPEGAIHQVWRLSWLSGVPLVQLARAVPVSDVVVLVDVPARAARARVKAKTGRIGPVNRGLMAADAGEWRQAARLYRRLLEQVRPRTRILRLPNRRGEEIATRRLLTLLDVERR